MTDRDDTPSPRHLTDRERFANLHAVDEFHSSVAGALVEGPAIVDLLAKPLSDSGRDLKGKEYWSLAEATFLLRGWLVEGASAADRLIDVMRPSEQRCHEESHLAELLSRMEIACAVGDLHGISTSSGTYVRLPEFLEWADAPPFPARFFGDPQDFPIKEAVKRFTARDQSYDEIREALVIANDRLRQLTSTLKGRRAVKLVDWTRFLWALAKSFQNRGVGTRQYAAQEIHALLQLGDPDVEANAPSFEQIKQWIEDAEAELELPLARRKMKKGE